MRILVTSGPMFGHVNTVLPLAIAARDAGHEVVVATGPELVDHVAARGVDVWSVGWSHEASGGRAALSPEYFVETGRRRAADLLPRAFEWSPDLIVHEEMELAGAVAAVATGARHAIHGLGVGLPRWVWDGMAPVVAQLAGSAGRRGAGVFDATYLRISPPSLPSPAVEQWVDVRPLRPAFGTPAGREQLPAAVVELLTAGDGPVVHLTLGTVFHETPGVFAAALDGLRRLDVRVVATIGPGVAPASLGPQPAHVVVAPYVSHALLLPWCSLVVSHAGAGIMFGALAHGLPQLLLPQGADQHGNAAACVAAGVAEALQTVDAPAVADSARRLLADGQVAQRAAAIGAEQAAMPGPDEVVDELTGGLSRGGSVGDGGRGRHVGHDRGQDGSARADVTRLTSSRAGRRA